MDAEAHVHDVLTVFTCTERPGALAVPPVSGYDRSHGL